MLFSSAVAFLSLSVAGLCVPTPPVSCCLPAPGAQNCVWPCGAGVFCAVVFGFVCCAFGSWRVGPPVGGGGPAPGALRFFVFVFHVLCIVFVACRAPKGGGARAWRTLIFVSAFYVLRIMSGACRVPEGGGPRLAHFYFLFLFFVPY